MSQSRRYCFTLNNYTDADCLRLDGLDCIYLIYGKETGASGTPHLQGFIIFESPVRFSAAKNLIGATAHLEAAKGTSKQASDYCRKDGSFSEQGTLPNSQGRRSDWDIYREYIIDLGRIPSRRELIRKFPSLFARYSRKCFEIAEAFLDPPTLSHTPPREGWQADLHLQLEAPPNDREITFVVDPEGSSGKSWFCKHALTTWPEKTQVLRIGKRDDLSYSIDNSKTIFLFDIPRTQMQFLQFSVLESLKDQMIFSPKYDSTLKMLVACPHVIVFCNEHPGMHELTNDRYNIINV